MSIIEDLLEIIPWFDHNKWRVDFYCDTVNFIKTDTNAKYFINTQNDKIYTKNVNTTLLNTALVAITRHHNYNKFENELNEIMKKIILNLNNEGYINQQNIIDKDILIKTQKKLHTLFNNESNIRCKRANYYFKHNKDLYTEDEIASIEANEIREKFYEDCQKMNNIINNIIANINGINQSSAPSELMKPSNSSTSIMNTTSSQIVNSTIMKSLTNFNNSKIIKNIQEFLCIQSKNNLYRTENYSIYNTVLHVVTCLQNKNESQIDYKNTQQLLFLEHENVCNIKNLSIFTYYMSIIENLGYMFHQLWELDDSKNSFIDCTIDNPNYTFTNCTIAANKYFDRILDAIINIYIKKNNTKSTILSELKNISEFFISVKKFISKNGLSITKCLDIFNSSISEQYKLNKDFIKILTTKKELETNLNKYDFHLKSLIYFVNEALESIQFNIPDENQSFLLANQTISPSKRPLSNSKESQTSNLEDIDFSVSYTL